MDAWIGPYRVLGELGRGGMGVVYRVAHPALEGERALKRLSVQLLDKDSLTRFVREAEALARLSHPHVVRVHELNLDPASGGPYLVTELVPGRDLASICREGPLPLPQALELGRQLAEALAALHQAGVLHRDLKPHNVIVTPEGRAVLLDFGLARDARGADRLTQTGVVLGTPSYMAPEQAQGGRADERSDVYGLGALCYHLLAGGPPFSGPTLQVLNAVLNKPPVPLRAVRPELPAEVDELIARAMAKDPARRFPDASSLEQALSELASGASARRRRRRRLVATLVGGGVLALLALAALTRLRPPGAAELEQRAAGLRPEERVALYAGWLARWGERGESAAVRDLLAAAQEEERARAAAVRALSEPGLGPGPRLAQAEAWLAAHPADAAREAVAALAAGCRAWPDPGPVPFDERAADDALEAAAVAHEAALKDWLSAWGAGAAPHPDAALARRWAEGYQAWRELEGRRGVEWQRGFRGWWRRWAPDHPRCPALRRRLASLLLARPRWQSDPLEQGVGRPAAAWLPGRRFLSWGAGQAGQRRVGSPLRVWQLDEDEVPRPRVLLEVVGGGVMHAAPGASGRDLALVACSADALEGGAWQVLLPRWPLPEPDAPPQRLTLARAREGGGVPVADAARWVYSITLCDLPGARLVALAYAGQEAASRLPGTVELWRQGPDGPPVRLGGVDYPEGARSCALSPDGRLLAVGWGGYNSSRVDVTPQGVDLLAVEEGGLRPLSRWPNLAAVAGRLGFLPDGRLLVASNDGNLYLLGPGSGGEWGSIQESRFPRGGPTRGDGFVAYSEGSFRDWVISPDGGAILAMTGEPPSESDERNELRVWQLPPPGQAPAEDLVAYRTLRQPLPFFSGSLEPEEGRLLLLGVQGRVELREWLPPAAPAGPH